MRHQPDIECVGGPYDGSLMPSCQPVLLVAQLERSLFLHVYELDREDDGTRFYRYAGTRERVIPPAPAAA